MIVSSILYRQRNIFIWSWWVLLLQSLEHPTQRPCAWNKVTQSGRISFVDALPSLYTELVSKGIITEQPKALGEGALFVFLRLGGGHLLNLWSISKLVGCDRGKPVWRYGLHTFKDWPPVFDYLLISETHFIMDCFYCSFLSCSCSILNILLVLSTVLIGRIRKNTQQNEHAAEMHYGGPFTYIASFLIVALYLL